MLSIYSPPPNAVFFGIWGRTGGGLLRDISIRLIPFRFNTPPLAAEERIRGCLEVDTFHR